MNNKEWLAGFKARIADQNMAGNEPKDWRGGWQFADAYIKRAEQYQPSSVSNHKHFLLEWANKWFVNK